MSLPRRQRRSLKSVAEAVRRSDPRLASMLAMFARLAADDDMPGHERLPATTAGRLARQLRAFRAVRAGPPVFPREESIMRSVRCMSPLPPDPIAAPGGSPLPPDPIAAPDASPLPPDPGPWPGGRAHA
jgi:hypothetical protein